MRKNNILHFILLCLVIVLVVAYRFFNFIPNFTPVAALALFSGYVFKNKKWAMIFPIITLFISDLIIGLYDPIVMVFTYLSFVIIALIGAKMIKKLKVSNVFLSSITASVTFFILSNFGVWLGGWYSYNWQGLINCYTMAIPFFRYEIVGTLLFSSVIFTIYHYVINPIANAQMQNKQI
ncbi:MAG TPA: hypothetical protein PKH87_04900 [Bacteroidales bacterium]|jgi:hypothetical protein|nr:hypothetical protein [Bacteroidales bacterium]HNY76081.1 hypothetical protein [Bacteroidales bacterium]HQJ58963.1 hypothetical protein [Bacteroidales bacterium]